MPENAGQRARMGKAYAKPVQFACVLLNLLSVSFLLFPGHIVAKELLVQEILSSLKSHQDKISGIEANFVMTLKGIDSDQELVQKGTYQFTAPDHIYMKYVEPRPMELKIDGKEIYLSIAGKPFEKMPESEDVATAVMGLYFYSFLEQFNLRIDKAHQSGQRHLHKVFGSPKDAAHPWVESWARITQLEAIYDSKKGLITQMHYTGTGEILEFELEQAYVKKHGCWIPAMTHSVVKTAKKRIIEKIAFDHIRIND